MTDIIIKDLIASIEDAAGKLQRNLRNGYTRGYEYSLADEITSQLATDEQRKAVLRYLIWEELTSWPMAGGVLDECAAESYALMGECTDRITDLAWQQIQAEGSDLVLRNLVTTSICDTQRVMALMAA
jgi:hypothetical protein